MDNTLVLPDGALLAAPADSPLGIVLGLVARLPCQMYQILCCEGGETYQKGDQITAALGAFYYDIDKAREQSYHLMAAVARQKGVNYDEPMVLCYLKPVFTGKAFSSWTIKTSAERSDEQAHLVLNRQRASNELAEYVPTRECSLDLVDASEVEILTGMQPGWVNFLMEKEHYFNSFIACLLQSDMIWLRPGETEYLGGKPEQSLDTALIEAPLGKAGRRYSLLVDGSTFFWILTEIQKHYPQIQFLGDQPPSADMLRLTLWQMGESLSQGLKSFKLHEGMSIFSYFSSMERYLKKYIHDHQPYIQSDTVAVFVREFIRNFFAVEGKTLYTMTDIMLSDSLEPEERLREVLYLFYRTFARTEFAKSMTAIDFDTFTQKLCADLLDQGIVNEFTLAILLENGHYHKLIEKYLPAKTKVKDLLEQAGEAASKARLLENLSEDPRIHVEKRYLRYEFSQETAKSEKYFVLHAQMVDLLPRFIARSARMNTHPLLTLEAMQRNIVLFFSERSQRLGISNSTIDNITRSFMRIILGRQIQLLDIIEDKLAICGISLQEHLGVGGVIAPDLVRVYNQIEYVALRERRKKRTKHLLELAQAAPGSIQHGSAYRQLVFSLILPDLENLMNLPPMREIFGSSESLYQRLVGL